MTKGKSKEFLEKAKPLIEWLNNNPEIVNPHYKIIVDCDSAELVSGEHLVKTQEFIKD